MKPENVNMLQYVAGALYGISLMMGDSLMTGDTDGELKAALASLSEEVSNVVISETIDREDAPGKVNIYVDDGIDDCK